MSAERLPAIGTLTDRIQLRRRVATSEDEGGESALFTPVATVWARVRFLATRATSQSEERGHAMTHSVVMRYRSDIKPGDRIVYRGRNLEIVAASDLNGRLAYLSCQCVEQAVTG